MTDKKYHLTKNGPSICTASIRDCPIGGEHYTDIKEAEREYSKDKDILPKVMSKKQNDTIHLSSNFIDAEVKNGDLSDPNARMALISGYCGDLAKEIIKINGGKPVFLSYNPLMTSEKLEEDFKVDPRTVFNTPHVLVTTDKPDVYLDAYGAKTLEEIEEHFEGAVPVIGTEEMLDKWMDKWTSTNTAPDLSEFAISAIKLYNNDESYEYDDELDEYEFDDDDYEDEDE